MVKSPEKSTILVSSASQMSKISPSNSGLSFPSFNWNSRGLILGGARINFFTFSNPDPDIFFWPNLFLIPTKTLQLIRCYTISISVSDPDLHGSGFGRRHGSGSGKKKSQQKKASEIKTELEYHFVIFVVLEFFSIALSPKWYKLKDLLVRWNGYLF